MYLTTQWNGCTRLYSSVLGRSWWVTRETQMRCRSGALVTETNHKQLEIIPFNSCYNPSHRAYTAIQIPACLAKYRIWLATANEDIPFYSWLEYWVNRPPIDRRDLTRSV